MELMVFSDGLEVSTNRCPDVRKKLTEVAKFLEHPSLRKLQSEVTTAVLGRRVTTTDLPSPPRIVPVFSNTSVRGWCGPDAIYINVAAFSEFSSRGFPWTLRADLCTILAHESQHFYMLVVEGDMNFSTPKKIGQ